MALAAGFVAVAAVIAPDYARQARSARDAALGSLLGLVPAALLLCASGAVLAIARDTHDIVEIFAGMGLPLAALGLLIVATWTTNVMNVYSAGLALGGLAGWGANRQAPATALAGLAGSALAAAGILGHLIGFLSLLTATVLPIAGVMIAAWWLPTGPGGAHRPWHWQGVIAWTAGVGVVLALEHPVRQLLGPLVSAAVFAGLARWNRPDPRAC